MNYIVYFIVIVFILCRFCFNKNECWNNGEDILYKKGDWIFEYENKRV